MSGLGPQPQQLEPAQASFVHSTDPLGVQAPLEAPRSDPTAGDRAACHPAVLRREYA